MAGSEWPNFPIISNQQVQTTAFTLTNCARYHSFVTPCHGS